MSWWIRAPRCVNTVEMPRSATSKQNSNILQTCRSDVGRSTNASLIVNKRYRLDGWLKIVLVDIGMFPCGAETAWAKSR